MPVLLRSRSTLNAPGTPILVVTIRQRQCGNCKGRARVTLWSPSTALTTAFCGDGNGQCCIRCTRELRSP